MSETAGSWLCPVCVSELPGPYASCRGCGAAAGWIDLLNAVDHSIRRYHLWKLEGALTAGQYRSLPAGSSKRREDMVQSDQAREAMPWAYGVSRSVPRLPAA